MGGGEGMAMIVFGMLRYTLCREIGFTASKTEGCEWSEADLKLAYAVAFMQHTNSETCPMQSLQQYAHSDMDASTQRTLPLWPCNIEPDDTNEVATVIIYDDFVKQWCATIPRLHYIQHSYECRMNSYMHLMFPSDKLVLLASSIKSQLPAICRDLQPAIFEALPKENEECQAMQYVPPPWRSRDVQGRSESAPACRQARSGPGRRKRKAGSLEEPWDRDDSDDVCDEEQGVPGQEDVIDTDLSEDERTEQDQARLYWLTAQLSGCPISDSGTLP